mmetsp:Transcript_4922/g.16137  ORF Transcript_4922/g.16137 Transcript_4922/m.16137 type:complete len:702 (+) Transcript_4922:547-2652(+)
MPLELRRRRRSGLRRRRLRRQARLQRHQGAVRHRLRQFPARRLRPLGGTRPPLDDGPLRAESRQVHRGHLRLRLRRPRDDGERQQRQQQCQKRDGGGPRLLHAERSGDLRADLPPGDLRRRHQPPGDGGDHRLPLRLRRGDERPRGLRYPRRPPRPRLAGPPARDDADPLRRGGGGGEGSRQGLRGRRLPRRARLGVRPHRAASRGRRRRRRRQEGRSRRVPLRGRRPDGSGQLPGQQLQLRQESPLRKRRRPWRSRRRKGDHGQLKECHGGREGVGRGRHRGDQRLGRRPGPGGVLRGGDQDGEQPQSLLRVGPVVVGDVVDAAAVVAVVDESDVVVVAVVDAAPVVDAVPDAAAALRRRAVVAGGRRRCDDGRLLFWRWWGGGATEFPGPQVDREADPRARAGDVARPVRPGALLPPPLHEHLGALPALRAAVGARRAAGVPELARRRVPRLRDPLRVPRSELLPQRVRRAVPRQGDLQRPQDVQVGRVDRRVLLARPADERLADLGALRHRDDHDGLRHPLPHPLRMGLWHPRLDAALLRAEPAPPLTAGGRAAGRGPGRAVVGGATPSGATVGALTVGAAVGATPSGAAVGAAIGAVVRGVRGAAEGEGPAGGHTAGAVVAERAEVVAATDAASVTTTRPWVAASRRDGGERPRERRRAAGQGPARRATRGHRRGYERRLRPRRTKGADPPQHRTGL